MTSIGSFKSNLRGFFRNRDRNYVMVAQLLGAVIALISGKLIALYVAPEDFGTYGIQFAAFTLFTTSLVSPAVQYLKANTSTLLPKIGLRPFLRLLSGVVLFSYALMAVFFYMYFGSVNVLLYTLLLLFIIFNAVSLVLTDFLNIQNQLVSFSNLNLIRGVASLLFVAIFFWFGSPYLSHSNALWAMQVVGAVVGLAFFYKTYHRFKGTITIQFKTFFKKYMRFAWPLAFSALWIWISNYFDRYAIEYFMDAEQVGIYSASYGVGSKFFLVLSPVFTIMATPLVFAPIPKDAKRTTLKRYGFYYSLIAIPVLVAIYFLGDFIGEILLSSEYSSGFFLIFWIAVAFYLITLAQLLELYFYSEKRTKIILLSNIVSALINVGLNVLLIPDFGIIGAGIATCAGFAGYFVVIFFNINPLNGLHPGKTRNRNTLN